MNSPDVGQLLKSGIEKVRAWLKRMNQAPENGSKASYKTTKQQKIILWAVNIGLFIFFQVLFFPTDAIIRHNINKLGEKHKFTLSWTVLDINFFTASKMEKVSYATAGGTEIQADLVEVDVRPWAYFTGSLSGSVTIKNALLDVADTLIRTDIQLEFDLNEEEGKQKGKKKGKSTYSGPLKLAMNQFILPPMKIEAGMFPIETKEIVFKSILLDSAVTSNMANFKKFTFDSEHLNGYINGTFKYDSPIERSQINANICIKPTKKFWADYPIASILKDNKDALCKLKLEGTPRSPKFNIKQILTEAFKSGPKLPGTGDDNN